MAIDGYGDREERGRDCEIWKEKRENFGKWVYMWHWDSDYVNEII